MADLSPGEYSVYLAQWQSIDTTVLGDLGEHGVGVYYHSRQRLGCDRFLVFLQNWDAPDMMSA